MADVPIAFPDFYSNMEDEDELMERVGGTTLDLNQELLEEKVKLGANAGHLAVQVSYKEKNKAGRSDDRENWTAPSAPLPPPRPPSHLLAVHIQLPPLPPSGDALALLAGWC